MGLTAVSCPLPIALTSPTAVDLTPSLQGLILLHKPAPQFPSRPSPKLPHPCHHGDSPPLPVTTHTGESSHSNDSGRLCGPLWASGGLRRRGTVDTLPLSIESSLCSRLPVCAPRDTDSLHFLFLRLSLSPRPSSPWVYSPLTFPL